MAHYRKTQMVDPTTQKYLESLGLTNTESCSNLSKWFCWYYPYEIFIDPDRIITDIDQLIATIYEEALNRGIEIGKHRANTSLKDALSKFVDATIN